jgi:hypothetical protein
MVLRFKSSTPEQFTLIGRDSHGRERSVTATKHSNDFNWQMRLQHPSGENWQATYHGPGGILDAMSELMRSKDAQFVQDRARGDRPPQRPFDYNRRIEADDFAIGPSDRLRLPR